MTTRLSIAQQIHGRSAQVLQETRERQRSLRFGDCGEDGNGELVGSGRSCKVGGTWFLQRFQPV